MLAKKAFFITVLLALFLVPALVPAAEEELFDTKAAAEQIEKGVQLLAAKKYDEAIAAFEEAVAAAPNAEAHYLLGYSYYMKGKSGDEDARQKAIENFDQAYQIDPNYTPNKIPPETITAPGAEQSSDEVTPAAAAPASKHEPGTLNIPAQPAPQQ